jgi:hypothetical protein
MPCQARRASEASYEDDDLYRSSMDALFDSKAGSDSLTSRAFLDSPPSSSSGAKLASLLALVLASTLSAYTTPAAASQHRRTVLLLVSLQSTLPAPIAVALAWLRPRGLFGGGRIGLGKAESGERRSCMLVGLLSMLSSLLGLWEARWLAPRVWQAVEVSA